MASYRHMENIAPGRSGLAVGSPKRAEILFAEQSLGGSMHGLDIQQSVFKSQLPGKQG